MMVVHREIAFIYTSVNLMEMIDCSYTNISFMVRITTHIND